MAGPYNLNPAALRVGMTNYNKYASLHGDTIKQNLETRESSPSIFALPRGSSSDEELDGQNVPNDESSDDSEFGRTRTKGKVEREKRPKTASDFSSANGEKIRKREPSVEPSNIRASKFTSGNCSQSSQKRKSVDVDDDEVPIAFSQSKKPRQSYGSTNKHRSSATKPGSPKKEPHKEGKKAGPAYKDVNIRTLEDKGKGSWRIGLLKRKPADLE